MSHYHIRWSGKAELDWERFDSCAEAQEGAKLLVRPGETYSIEEHDESCPRCQATWKMTCSKKAVAASNLKYPWQRVVADAFSETRPEFVPWKVNVAERTIATRLRAKSSADNEEKVAIREALNSLKALLPRREELKKECGDEKHVA